MDINKVVDKWTFILKESLNITNKLLIEKYSLFAENYNKNLDYQIFPEQNTNILPLALKILSKLDINPNQIHIDYTNSYKKEIHKVNFKIDVTNYNEMMGMGIDLMSRIEFSIVKELNEILKNKKAILVISTFIKYLTQIQNTNLRDINLVLLYEYGIKYEDNFIEPPIYIKKNILKDIDIEFI